MSRIPLRFSSCHFPNKYNPGSTEIDLEENLPEVGVDPLLRYKFESNRILALILGSVNNNGVDTSVFGSHPLKVDQCIASLVFEDFLI